MFSHDKLKKYSVFGKEKILNALLRHNQLRKHIGYAEKSEIELGFSIFHVTY